MYPLKMLWWNIQDWWLCVRSKYPLVGDIAALAVVIVVFMLIGVFL